MLNGIIGLSSKTKIILIILGIGIAVFLLYKLLQGSVVTPRVAPAKLDKSQPYEAVIKFDELRVTWLPIKLRTGYETLRAITHYNTPISDGIYFGRLLTEDTSALVEFLKFVGILTDDYADVILDKYGQRLIFVLASSFDDLAGQIYNKPEPVTDDIVELRITAKLNINHYEEAFEPI